MCVCVATVTRVGTVAARTVVTAEPAIAPAVPPTAMKPKSRAPCAGVKTSAATDQKIDTTNRLNTDVQMKKTRPAQTAPTSSTAPSTRKKTTIEPAKNSQ